MPWLRVMFCWATIFGLNIKQLLISFRRHSVLFAPPPSLSDRHRLNFVSVFHYKECAVCLIKLLPSVAVVGKKRCFMPQLRHLSVVADASNLADDWALFRAAQPRRSHFSSQRHTLQELPNTLPDTHLPPKVNAYPATVAKYFAGYRHKSRHCVGVCIPYYELSINHDI